MWTGSLLISFCFSEMCLSGSRAGLVPTPHENTKVSAAKLSFRRPAHLGDREPSTGKRGQRPLESEECVTVDAKKCPPLSPKTLHYKSQNRRNFQLCNMEMWEPAAENGNLTNP